MKKTIDGVVKQEADKVEPDINKESKPSEEISMALKLIQLQKKQSGFDQLENL